jgi:hypothetical protein
LIVFFFSIIQKANYKKSLVFLNPIRCKNKTRHLPNCQNS